VGPEGYKTWGEGLFKKKNINHEYRISYEREYLFRMRKEVATNCKIIKS